MKLFEGNNVMDEDIWNLTYVKKGFMKYIKHLKKCKKK